MIRDVVVHLLNEQPVLVDLFSEPTAADTGIVCTNLRTLDGKRPIFIDRVDSTFVIPYLQVRFLEIHPTSDEPAAAGGTASPPEASPTGDPGGPAAAPTDDDDLEIDEDFLRRIRDA